MDVNFIKDSFLMIIIPLIFVAVMVPIVKKMAAHVNALDIPNSRKVHTKPIPRLGGIAIVSGFLFGYMMFCEPSALMNSILIGGFIIVLTGMVDDINPLSAKVKFLGQLAAVAVVVFYGNLTLSSISAFGLYIDFKIFTLPFTFFFLLGCINCLNFIDGLDGLAAGISGIYFITVGIICLILQRTGVYYSLSLIMLGCCGGFLIYNFHPASIFMGDSGSMFLGYVIGVIALLGFKNVVMTSFIIPLLILAIPILDTLFAIIRRRLRGESIAKPDKCHIHHQLLKKNFSHKTTVIIIYVIDSLFAFASIVYVLKDRVLGYIIYGILLVIVIAFVLTTDVVCEFPDKEKNFLSKFKHKK